MASLTPGDYDSGVNTALPQFAAAKRDAAHFKMRAFFQRHVQFAARVRTARVDHEMLMPA